VKSEASCRQQIDDPAVWADRINDSLARLPDKEWNYSRIRLVAHPVDLQLSPYMLVIEHVMTSTTEGKAALKNAQAEVSWGERHSNELGILELISLRLNRLLLAQTEDWPDRFPLVRIAKSEELLDQGVSTAMWYDVKEVSGEDFDTR
jgi:hypothetical protein